MKPTKLLPVGGAALRISHPSHEQIATLAFSLYVSRGRQPGQAREDWLEAEEMLLLAATHPPANQPNPPDHNSPRVDTPVREHPHARDARHSQSREEIRQMNTNRRPAAHESLRSPG